MRLRLLALAAALPVLAGGALAAAQEPPPSPAPPPAPADCSAAVAEPAQIGASVEGRPLLLLRVGAAPGCPVRRTVLVIGAVHGDEGAGRAIVERLATAPPPEGTQLLLVRSLNPDGIVHGVRAIARGVDLNRNSREGWRRLGPPGALEYAGPGPFSEPESRAIRALVLAERPDVVVWYHQPLGLVDVPETGSVTLAQRYAALARLPVRRLRAYPGSLSRWVNARVRPGSSFVVELRAGRLSASAARRHARAVLALAAR